MSRKIREQDVSWFLDRNKEGNLNLSPPYQRRSVWTRKDQRFFIDTIMNHYPSPPIYLHQTRDETGTATFHVVDGKQRLEAIIAFRDNKVKLPEDSGNANLRNKAWRDLGREERDVFWNYPMFVEFISDTDDSYIRNVFDRINRNSRKLVPQELRHARFDGWFISTAEREADLTEWRDYGVVTTARAKRMQDVQFISELMQVTIRGAIQGFSQDGLDDLYAEFDQIDEHPTFVEEDFRSSFDMAKSQIRDLTSMEPEITRFLRIQNHLYTLWGYLSVVQPPLPTREHAAHYIKFLIDADTVVESMADNENVAGLNEPTAVEGSYRLQVARYALNLRGASTDLAGRQARHDALTSAMQSIWIARNEGQ